MRQPFRCPFPPRGAVTEVKQFLYGKVCIDVKADTVTKGHLSNRSSDTALADGMHGFDLTVDDSLMEEIAVLLKGIEVRHPFAVTRQVEEEDGIASRLKFRRNDMIRVFRSNGKGNEGRRNGKVFKGTAHAVFPADGSHFHDLLGDEGTEEGTDWLAPGRFILAQALEEFLHRKVHFFTVTAEGHQFSNGLDDGIEGTVKGLQIARSGS